MLQIFTVLVFLIVPVRTYISNRRDINELPFFIGQFIYGIMWFALWATGMLVIVEFSNIEGVVYIALIYGFLSALDSTLMLILQKGRAGDVEAKNKAKIDKTARKFFKNTGAKK